MKRMQNIVNEPLSMSIYNASVNNEQTTTGINGRFVHFQLLIDCLLRMQSTSTDINEFISLCLNKNHENKQTLKIIKEFQETYSSDHSIWWYTRDTFLYRLLNESLRVQDIDSLFGLRFIICDIEQQLRQNQCSSAVCLYRGQLIAKEELEILRQSKGELISMNSFLSTTLEREVALLFVPSPNENKDNKLKSVLFEIDVDPRRKGIKPFADISSLSAFPVENEVLMMAGSVFRLDDIHMDEDQRWIINMTLCSDHDHDLKSVVDHMKDQYGTEQTRLLVFGHVLVDMAHFDDAEKYYLRLLKELAPDDSDIPHCYHALGKVACEKADYESSLQWLRKSYEIVRQKVRKSRSQIGFIRTSMGEVYQKKGDYKQALKSYEKALRIWTKIYNDQHEYAAWCFNNIGNIYDAEKKYSEE
jgi:tetratricopeptide (TPR) repeat protein